MKTYAPSQPESSTTQQETSQVISPTSQELDVNQYADDSESPFDTGVDSAEPKRKMPVTGISKLAVGTVGHIVGMKLTGGDVDKAKAFAKVYAENTLPVLEDDLKLDEAIEQLIGVDDIGPKGAVVLSAIFLGVGVLIAKADLEKGKEDD